MISTRSSLLRSLAALGLAVGLGAVGACSGPSTADAGSTSPETTASASATPTGEGVADATFMRDTEGQVIELAYPGRDGVTALDLLREYDPSASTSGEGETAFVTGIDGREADQAEQQFWALYVDEEFAQVGAGALETEDGQVIRWKLETWE